MGESVFDRALEAAGLPPCACVAAGAAACAAIRWDGHDDPPEDACDCDCHPDLDGYDEDDAADDPDTDDDEREDWCEECVEQRPVCCGCFRCAPCGCWCER